MEVNHVRLQQCLPSRPGTRGTFGSHWKHGRPSTGDIRDLKTRESLQSGGNATSGGILRQQVVAACAPNNTWNS